MNMIQDLTNFRDLGGIRTKSNAVIKDKHLLRSGELYQLSSSDKEILQSEYNLRLVVDLRSRLEIQNNPDDTIAQANHLHLDVMKNLPEDAPGMEGLLEYIDLARVDVKMKNVYKVLVLDSGAQEEYHRFVKAAAGLNDGSCLFHCFAGKDRTGLAAAILLEILEVNRDDIFADYLQTNQLRRAANQNICEEAHQQGASKLQLEALEQLLLVKDIYLAEAYDAIEETYGSFEHYLTDGLLVAPDTVEALRVRCLH